VFSATQDIDYNKQIITASESTIKACEEELLRLTEIGEYTRSSVFGTDRAVSLRTRYLLNTMGEASAKIESLERANAKLKKLLTTTRRTLPYRLHTQMLTYNAAFRTVEFTVLYAYIPLNIQWLLSSDVRCSNDEPQAENH
jgi:hypothetical protein